MGLISCPKCNAPTPNGGFYVWQILVAVCFFPIGLLALLAPRKPKTCPSCQFKWE